MKNAIKRSLSLLLAITIIFSSAYVGLGEIDFSGVNFNGLFTVKAQAASSGTCGTSVTWSLDDEGTLTISGSGDMKSYSSYSNSPWYSSRTSIKNVVIANGVTSIGGYAFYNCTSLTTITIPDSVTSIGDEAFSHCDSLTTVTIPEGVTSVGNGAFYWCASLLSITIPDSVTSMGMATFACCENLTTVTLGKGITHIGESMFDCCEKLFSVVIPEGLVSIGDYAFNYCTSLEYVCYSGNSEDFLKINIGEYNNPFIFVTTRHYGCTGYGFGEWQVGSEPTCTADGYEYKACLYCSAREIRTLEKLEHNYVNGVCVACATTLGIEFLTFDLNPDNKSYYVKCNSSAEGEIVIPSTYNGLPVTSIGDYAFYWSGGITSLTIPDSITSIGYAAFYNFPSRIDVYYGGTRADWEKITIEDHNKTLNVHYHVHEYDSEWVVNAEPTCTDVGLQVNTCKSCGDIVTETIEPNGHSYVDGVCTVCANANGVEYLGFELNSDNESYYVKHASLAEGIIVIPSTYNNLPVTSIGDYAFADCTKLTSITIPDSVTSIGKFAFEDCTSLSSITIGDGLTSIGRSAFYDCESLTSVYITDISAWCNIDFYDAEANPLRYANNLYLNGELVTDVALPNTVTNINDYAFYGCTKLTSITIPNSVTSIGNYAFMYCYGLTSVELENGIESIGRSAFYYCTSLTSITVPDSVTNIGDSAFGYCKNIVVSANCNSYTAKYSYLSSVVNKFHDISTDWTIDKEPTCTEDGSKSHHCSRCVEKWDVTVIESFGHTFSDWQIRLEPSCTESGIEYKTCSTCSAEETNFIPALGHRYPEKGNVISQPTTTEPGLQIKVCEICKKDAIYEDIPVLEAPTLKELNGQWVYANGNTIITDYTGLVEYNGSWFYVANGILDWNYTGLVEYGGTYYHIANGVLDWNYTGLSYYQGNWWYVTNGVIDWSYTGLTYYYGTWYYVTNGFLDWNVTTLTYFYDAWYYVENGVLNWNYTGLAEFCGNYYHIANGVLDWGYTGLSYYNGNWWYVTNGVIDWSYTGLTCYYGTWYYVTNGFLDWNVTTLTYFYDVWYYVENGQINWNSNTLCYYGDTWYYVKGGTVAWDYTGWVEYYGGWYYITNGWLDWSKQ